jgi:hypothetical protein
VRGALQNVDDFDRVLTHELTHAMLRSVASRNLPAWLNEGLATALESSDLDWAQKAVQQAGGGIALRSLQSGFGRFAGAQAQLAYATSALAVRTLLDEAGGFAIANLLRDLGSGADFESAFAHRFQRSFDDFRANPF